MSGFSAPSAIQLEILQRLFEGETDSTIGRSMRIADRTVRLHIQRLQTITQVQGRFALGAVAHAYGWINLEPLQRRIVEPERPARPRPAHAALPKPAYQVHSSQKSINGDH